MEAVCVAVRVAESLRVGESVFDGVSDGVVLLVGVTVSEAVGVLVGDFVGGSEESMARPRRTALRELVGTGNGPIVYRSTLALSVDDVGMSNGAIMPYGVSAG